MKIQIVKANGKFQFRGLVWKITFYHSIGFQIKIVSKRDIIFNKIYMDVMTNRDLLCCKVCEEPKLTEDAAMFGYLIKEQMICCDCMAKIICGIYQENKEYQLAIKRIASYGYFWNSIGDELDAENK